MSYELGLLLLFVSFTVFFTVGIPLAMSLLLSSVLVIFMDPDLDAIIISMRVYSGMDSFILLAIPGFMFAAFFMNKVGVTQDIVEMSDLLVGRVRGGLSHINVISSMLMGGVSGSSTADVAGVGAILIPPMEKQGYEKGFAASLTAASSTIGSVIPPSILMVIYGAAANVSVGALFIAGYIPGILVGFQQLGINYYYASKNNIGGQKRIYAPGERLKIILKGFAPISIMVIIIGGIVGGIMTATEAAAAASVWVVVIALLFYRPITWRMVMDVTLETGLLTAVVMFCVGTATLFGWLMAYYQIIDVTEELFQALAFSGPIFLLFATALFLFLGTFMDPAPAMLIFVPVMAPVAISIGVNPLQLGIIVVMALAIGKITPPYGISQLLACTIAEIPLMKSMKWNLVFFFSFVLLMVAIIFFPQITLLLPRIMVPELAGG